MGREFELKYRSTPEIIEKIAEKYGEFTAVSMETTYYDTFDGKLFNRRWTLRRRLENEVSVCTLKIPLDDGSRGEWETEADSIESAIPVLCNLGAPKQLLYLTAAGVEPFCGARFTRLAKLISTDTVTIELALDQGILLGGGKELSFAEVEVEYKHGREADAVTFAQTLAGEFHLVPEPKSKVARAMALTQTI
jgi:inorganic triphosphatase YgiF